MSDTPEADDPPEPCCVCGRPSTHDYADREDCPVCDKLACGFRVQQFLDYSEEVGNR